MDQIIPGLFLGNARASKDLASLEENKITHILVVARELKAYHDDVSKLHKNKNKKY